jgi:hypothetical protein
MHKMTTLTECPECGLPAEVRERYSLPTTHGRVEHVKTMCAVRHVRTVTFDPRRPSAPL